MKITEKKLIEMVRAGYGQGHGESYRPFLENTRSAISKKGTQSSGKVLYGLDRACDFKSRQEKRIAKALLWLGAADIREQYPIWPMPHPHPLVGARGSEGVLLEDAPGLVSIAKEAGIPHGVFIGTTTPYVATIDFMVTVYTNRVPRLIALACKNREIVSTTDRPSRALERLELERRYFELLKIPYLIINNDVFGNTLLANLDWLMPDRSIVTDIIQDRRLESFYELVRENIFNISINEIVKYAQDQISWPAERCYTAFRYFAWTQILDIDLTRPILMSEPAVAGGIEVHRALQQCILGEIDDE